MCFDEKNSHACAKQFTKRLQGINFLSYLTLSSDFVEVKGLITKMNVDISALERRTHYQKIAGSIPGWRGGIFFFFLSVLGQLSMLTVISVSLPPAVATVARKTSQSLY